MDLAGGVPGGQPAAQVPALRRLRLAGGEERVQLEQLERAAHDALRARTRSRRGPRASSPPPRRRARTARPPAARRRRRRRAPCDAACSATRGGDLVAALVDVRDEQHRLGGQRLQQARDVRRVLGHRHRARRPARLQRRDHLAQPASPRRSRPCRRRAPRARRARAGARPARGRRRSARSRSCRCRARGSTLPSGWMTFGSPCARTTWTIASVSRMFARNWLPSPSPLCAPAHEAGDVVEGDRVPDDLRRADDLGDLLEPLVRAPGRRRRSARSS